VTSISQAIVSRAVPLIAVLFAATAQAADKKPNFVYIVADDLGWKDVGFHGSDIKTPALDKLATTGARLESLYAQPMCTPTRACLMTGRYPFRYGLQTCVILSGQTYGLPVDEWLLPQSLKEAGYSTAIIGKWHLGHGDRKYWPRQRGFDYQYGPLLGEIDYFTHTQHGVLDWYRNGEKLIEEGYSTTLIGNEAVKFIDRQEPDKPFYLYLTFNAPHAPFQAPREYLDRYRHVADLNRRAYAAMVTAMDDQIRRVIDALDRKGLRNDTLVVFQSDNGGTRDARLTGEGSVSTVPCDNGPYRDGKGSLYEGGTRVVALTNWPGRIEPGIVVNGLMHVVDMYPTIAKLAGASTAKCKPLDGMDVWATLSQGKSSPRTEVVYNVEPFRGAIRRGDWKLIWRSPLPSALELYDLAKDPSEKRNLAAQNPATVAELQKRINDLAAAMAKPLYLQTEFRALRERLHMPPAIAGDELQFDGEP
jgi:arylsulfatase A-like enzyme